MRAEYFTAFDNSKIHLYFWNDVKQPKAVLQIAHGMAEHALRYRDFAEFMNAHNIIVIADDHRAFGQTAPPDENGVYAGDVFGDTLRDLLDINAYAHQRWPELPLFFLGHSYGSFLGQAFIQEAGDKISRAVLMGSNYLKNPFYSFMSKLLQPFRAVLGYERPAKLLHALNFGAYDKQFDEGPCAWLSRDQEQVARYIEDPLCGQICSIGFYQSFLNVARLYRAEKLARIPKKLPLLLISGAEDPVNGGRGKARGLHKLYKMYEDLGLENVELKLYPGARHELLNEINRAEVYADLAEFLTGQTL